MLELDPAMNSPVAQGDAILLADPSMTGGAIAVALRARGLVVIEVSAGSLSARALAEAPRAIIVDVDQPGAIEAVERARELLSASPPELFCIGDPLRAAELGMTRAAGRVFSRPVDVSAVVFAVARLASSGDAPFAQRRPTLPPRNNESEPPAPYSEVPSTADPLEVAAILPSSDELSSSSRHFLSELSPELERILASAEHRVTTQHHPSDLPSPEEELDLLLPPDLLAALDEPLDPDEEGAGTGSGAGGTGAARLATSTFGSRAASTTAGPVHDGAPLAKASSAPNPGYDGAPLARASSAPNPGYDGAPLARASSAPNSGYDGPPLGKPSFAPSSVADMTGSESPAQRAPIGELTEARVPVSVMPQQGTDHRFESKPLAPVWERRSSSTLPPGSEQGAPPPSVEPAAPAREWSPTLESLSMFRPAAIPRPNVTPLIRDGGAPSRPSAIASLSADVGAPLKTSPSLILPAPPAEMGRGQSLQEMTSPGRSSPSSAPPVALGEGDALLALARAIAARASGALAIGAEPSLRRIVIHDGDIVTAGSTAADESLLAFLSARGDLPREVAAHLAGRLPPFGRHAGAALIAHGYLGQDDLWPVLRAHAEWLIGRAILCESGTWELDPELPGRLKAEPNVFGGAAGAEVLVEQVRRVVPPELALRRIGGATARLADGSRRTLLTECALRREEEDLVRSAPGRAVAEIVRGAEPELANVIYALVALGVLDALAPVAPAPAGAPESVDLLDVEALRQRVRARAALVEDGDYFALLGVPRTATGYEVRRAYLDLRRSFEPARVLTAATADLAADVRLIVEVLDEAYEILRDPHRRERYRKAIDSGPP